MSRNVERRRTRSDHYQHLLLELTCSTELMEAFSNEDGIYKRLNPFDYDEQILILEEQLKKEFWRIVDTMLTERQRDVIKLYSDGYTQMEIAKKLKVNQSSITKSLNGNVDYKNNSKKTYGGSRRKIRKIIENDEVIKDILNKMTALREEKW